MKWDLNALFLMSKAKSWRNAIMNNRNNINLILYPLAGFFYLMYISGLIFPDIFWGVHFIAFLPLPIQILFLLLPPVCIIPGVSTIINLAFETAGKFLSGNKLIISAFLIALGLAAIFFFNPIVTDIYGDSTSNNYIHGPEVENFSSDNILEIISPNIFTAKNDLKFDINIIKGTAFYLNIDIIRAFRLANAFLGFLFVFSWILFTGKIVENDSYKTLLLILGLTNCAMQFFFGNSEIYAFAFVTILWYLGATAFFLKYRKKKYLIILPLLLFLSIKAHSANFALVPAYLLSMLWYFKRKSKIFNWKNIFIFVIIPIFIIGAFIYVFVLQDYDKPYAYADNIKYLAIFLPVIGASPPVDSYTLFSWEHIFDYFNMAMLWSVPALVIIVLAISKFRNILSEAPVVVKIAGLTLILYAAMFFAINPLLSMERDWDLLSVPAPVLLFFALLLISKYGGKFIKPGNIGIFAAFALLNLPVFIIHANEKMTSGRLESAGIRVYHTYWANSAFMINRGLSKFADDKEYSKSRYNSVLNRISPRGVKEIDEHYANILNQAGNLYFEEGDFKKALKYFEMAHEYFEGNSIIQTSLMISYYETGAYQSARKSCLALLEKQPENANYQRWMIGISNLLKDDKNVREYAPKYLERFPDDKEILEIWEKISAD